ncbi:hypothetical protein [Priestia aryabhattai]|uniref:hypothetical protein n=1 Tax=Priestia aryabhattai TaxID=412384 RepID=UPI0015F3ED4E|nr:hypothetical protein [Priestia aryabhattai]
MLDGILNKIINKMGIDDYFFIVPQKNEYNTTGKIELHSLDSFEPILTGFSRIIRALMRDWFFRKFMY